MAIATDRAAYIAFGGHCDLVDGGKLNATNIVQGLFDALMFYPEGKNFKGPEKEACNRIGINEKSRITNRFNPDGSLSK
jgi:hypothetical protein